MKARPLFEIATALAILASGACSSSGAEAPDYTGSCAALASRCHDSTTPLGSECHDLGHDGDEAKCGPRKDACLAECASAPAPSSSASTDDAGPKGVDTPDAGEARDAAPTSPCAAYCACMGTTCASEAGYPFASEAACLSACSTFDSKGLACVVTACEKAKTAKSPSSKSHECEHGRAPSGCH